MINQSKINSFIGLIAKNHSDHKHHKYKSFFRKPHCHTQQPTNQIFDQTQFNHDNEYSLDELNLNHTRHFFNQTLKDKLQMALNQAQKHRKTKHDNLYNLYRQSLEKKKSSILAKKVEELEFRLPHSKRKEYKVKKDINFPINRPSKSSKNNSFKIMKKRQLTTPSIDTHQINSHIKPHSYHSKIAEVLQKEAGEDISPDADRQTKPFFRIKKCSQFRDSNTIDQRKECRSDKKPIEMQQNRFRFKSYLRASTESAKAADSKNSPRSRRYFKNSEKIMRIDPWDYDQEKGQLQDF